MDKTDHNTKLSQLLQCPQEKWASLTGTFPEWNHLGHAHSLPAEASLSTLITFFTTFPQEHDEGLRLMTWSLVQKLQTQEDLVHIEASQLGEPFLKRLPEVLAHESRAPDLVMLFPAGPERDGMIAKTIMHIVHLGGVMPRADKLANLYSGEWQATKEEFDLWVEQVFSDAMGYNNGELFPRYTKAGTQFLVRVAPKFDGINSDQPACRLTKLFVATIRSSFNSSSWAGQRERLFAQLLPLFAPSDEKSIYVALYEGTFSGINRLNPTMLRSTAEFFVKLFAYLKRFTSMRPSEFDLNMIEGSLRDWAICEATMCGLRRIANEVPSEAELKAGGEPGDPQGVLEMFYRLNLAQQGDILARLRAYQQTAPSAPGEE